MKFRKKPVVIDAIQWNGANTAAVYEFIHGKFTTPRNYMDEERWFEYDEICQRQGMIIRTLEDGNKGEAKHVASVGDWIIKGIQGEHYPCKPDIFKATYEAVDEVKP